MYQIKDVMTVKEAVDRWGVSRFTLRDRLAGRSPAQKAEIERALEDGEVKRYKGSGERYEWLLTTDIMTKWFGEEPKKIKKL